MKLQTRSEVLVEGARIRVWMETGPAPLQRTKIQSLLHVAAISPEGLILAERIVDRSTQDARVRSQRAIDLLHRISRVGFLFRARSYVETLPEPGPTL